MFRHVLLRVPSKVEMRGAAREYQIEQGINSEVIEILMSNRDAFT